MPFLVQAAKVTGPGRPGGIFTGGAGISFSPNLISHTFIDGAPGPYNDLWSVSTGGGSIDFVSDPTGAGRGNIPRYVYTVSATTGINSNDVQMIYNTGPRHFRYGETIWFKGDVYFPSAVLSGTHQYNLTRKMLYYFPMVTFGPSLVIERTGGILQYYVGQIEDDHNYHTDIVFGNTPVTLLDDTWYTVEVMYKLNSADGVKDGVLEIYVNNPTSTPNFRLASGIFPITQGVNGGTTPQQAMFNSGGGYFNNFYVGNQITNNVPPDLAISENRYWDNFAFSTQRIGTILSDFTGDDTPTSLDIFTGTNGTQLENHTADSGHFWFRETVSNTDFHLLLNGSGELYNSATIGDAPEWYVSTQRPPTSDYTVSADLVFLTNDITQAGLLHSAQSSGGKFYKMVFWGDTTFTWKLYRWDGTTFSTAASWDAGASAYTNGQVIPIQLVRTGAVIDCWIGGVKRMSFTDGTPLPAKSHPGLGIQAGFSTTRGQRLRNFRVL